MPGKTKSLRKFVVFPPKKYNQIKYNVTENSPDSPIFKRYYSGDRYNSNELSRIFVAEKLDPAIIKQNKAINPDNKSTHIAFTVDEEGNPNPFKITFNAKKDPVLSFDAARKLYRKYSILGGTSGYFSDEPGGEPMYINDSSGGGLEDAYDIIEEPNIVNNQHINRYRYSFLDDSMKNMKDNQMRRPSYRSTVGRFSDDNGVLGSLVNTAYDANTDRLPPNLFDDPEERKKLETFGDPHKGDYADYSQIGSLNVNPNFDPNSIEVDKKYKGKRFGDWNDIFGGGFGKSNSFGRQLKKDNSGMEQVKVAHIGFMQVA